MNDPPTSHPPGMIRDRLANERTLLAWMRTAMAMMGFGLVIAKFGVLAALVAGAELGGEAGARELGVALVVVGVAVNLVGFARTRAYARRIDPEGRSPGDGVLAISSAVVAALGVGLAVYLVLG